MRSLRAYIIVSIVFLLFASASLRAENYGGSGGGFAGGGNNGGNYGNNVNFRNQGGGYGGGGGGFGGGSSGGGSGQYQQRMTSKLEDSTKMEKEKEKAMSEALKSYSSDLQKSNAEFGKTIKESQIKEDDKLLAQIAKEASNVVQMTGIGSKTVDAMLGETKTLGDTIAKQSLVMANAALEAAKKATPTPEAPRVTQAEAMAAFTGGAGRNNSGLGAALQAGSGPTSVPGRLKGQDGQLDGGIHAERGLASKGSFATSIPKGLIHNMPALKK